MLTIVYLLLGLAFMGGLFYALTQITARQRRLQAELTRLERLAAEVSLSAEAILDRVDERTHQLTQLVERAEARVTAAVAAPVVEAPVAEAPKKRSRKKKVEEPASVVEPVAEAPAAQAPTPIQKYQDLRASVWAMADKGRDAAEIAQSLGVPRGEVQLLLNLRKRKVTA